MHRALIAFWLATVVCPATAQDVRPPTGWRFPGESDYRSSWAEFRKDIPRPFKVQADFNGDGLPDQAWILIRDNPKAWGVFVFVAQRDGGYKLHEVLRVDGDNEPQDFGISLAQPGRYKTACGKGYWECKKDEPETLVLRGPAINYFKYESASSVIYWTGQRFRTVAISD